MPPWGREPNGFHRVEAKKRVLAIVAQMDKEDCATCTNLSCVILEGHSPDRSQSIKKDCSDAALFVYGGGGQPHKANAATVLARALLSLKVGT